jgi:hypothetical protein
MRAFIKAITLIFVLGFPVRANEVDTVSALKRFLAIKTPSTQQDLNDIYFSMMEIDHNIETNPNYDTSIIVKWLDQVELILKTREMKPFLSTAHLDKADLSNFDMLARNIWFPDDFRFTSRDEKLLRLLKSAATNQTKD